MSDPAQRGADTGPQRPCPESQTAQPLGELRGAAGYIYQAQAPVTGDHKLTVGHRQRRRVSVAGHGRLGEVGEASDDLEGPCAGARVAASTVQERQGVTGAHASS